MLRICLKRIKSITFTKALSQQCQSFCAKMRTRKAIGNHGFHQTMLMSGLTILKTLRTDDKEEINKYLEKIWDVFISRGGLIAKAPDQYVMDISRFKIRTSFSHEIKWYICSKCGKLTATILGMYALQIAVMGSLKNAISKWILLTIITENSI